MHIGGVEVQLQSLDVLPPGKAPRTRWIRGYVGPRIVTLNVLTHSLTLWYRTLFETWVWLSLLNILLPYGTTSHATVFTKAHQWTLSWASRIQFFPSISVSLRSILMLSSHLRLGIHSGLFPSGLRNKTCEHLFTPPCVPHIRPTYPALFNHPNSLFWKTISLCSSRKARDHVSYPYSVICKITRLYIFIFRISWSETGKQNIWDWMRASIPRI